MSTADGGSENDDPREEISEGTEDENQEKIAERYRPRTGLGGAFKVTEIAFHREETRRRSTYFLLGLLGVLAVGSGALLGAGQFTLDEMNGFLSQVFVPVVALTGTALGFFFADKRS